MYTPRELRAGIMRLPLDYGCDIIARSARLVIIGNFCHLSLYRSIAFLISVARHFLLTHVRINQRCRNARTFVIFYCTL